MIVPETPRPSSGPTQSLFRAKPERPAPVRPMPRPQLRAEGRRRSRSSKGVCASLTIREIARALVALLDVDRADRRALVRVLTRSWAGARVVCHEGAHLAEVEAIFEVLESVLGLEAIEEEGGWRFAVRRSRNVICPPVRMLAPTIPGPSYRCVSMI